MRGRPKPEKEDQRELQRHIEDGMQADIDHEDALIRARAAPRLFATLRPAVPIDPDRTYPGWFGGAPDLPEDVPWPEVADEPAHFLCQIDCAALPAGLWQGAGPREGWLRIFAGTYWSETDWFTGLWTAERGTPRDGPGPAEADWFRAAPSLDPALTTIPRWPIDIASCEDLKLATPDHQEGFQTYRHAAEMDLRDPCFQPFDAATVRLLLSRLRKDLERWQRFPESWAQNQPQMEQADRDYLTAFQPRIDDAVSAFEAVAQRVEAGLQTNPSHGEVISRMVDELAGIVVPRAGKQEAAKPFEETATPLTGMPPVLRSNWPQDYREALYEHAKAAYAADPAALPPQQRAFFERVWAEDAACSVVTMGAVPRGFAATACGPDAEHALLMEFTTSQLLNWIWGDMYNLVLAVPRQDLAAHRFDRLTAEITN